MNSSGGVIGMTSQGNAKVYGYPAFRVRRSILRQELLRLCREQNIPVVYEKKLLRIEEGNENVALYFTDGTSVTTSHLIGADGIHSAVREQLSPGYRPQYDGMFLIYGMMKRDKLRANVKNWRNFPKDFAILAKEGSFIMQPTDYAGEEAAYFFSFVLPDRSEEEWERLRNDKEELRRMLVAQYCGKGWPEEIEVLCRETLAEEFWSWA